MQKARSQVVNLRSSAQRTFLSRAWRIGAAAGLARCASWDGVESLLAQGAISKDRLLVRSVRPQDLETPVALLKAWITPNELFYVRSPFYTPSVDLDTWTLTVDGDIERSLSLRMADLRQMPRISIDRVRINVEAT
jgi:DMSO/TMAO reductase YedYZ molybdopterin-dependent catalytic subunit